jgi:hypothetical protein
MDQMALQSLVTALSACQILSAGYNHLRIINMSIAACKAIGVLSMFAIKFGFHLLCGGRGYFTTA